MKSYLSYGERLEILRRKKIVQTREKIEKEGGLDEDDYGRVVPPDTFHWSNKPNHSNGSFYGLDGWADNYERLLKMHPIYVDPLDALAGRWMFFLSRMKGPRWNPDYDFSHLQKWFKKYDIIPGIGYDAHFAPDFQILLDEGWNGILKKIEYYNRINQGKQHFYEAHRKVILAIKGWIHRTIDEMYHLTETLDDKFLKKNIQEMIEVNETILDNTPNTLREACQLIAWFNMATRTYNRDGAGGQLDTLLLPYYRNDIEKGTITDEDAVFYIACLLLNDTHYYQLGGPDENGDDITNHLSYLILEAANNLNVSCNLTVRYFDGLNRNFFLKSVRSLMTNMNGCPRFSGDKALVEGFIRNGYSKKMARRRIAVGCNWMSLPGLEYTLNDLVKINTAKVFEVAFLEMMNSNSKKKNTKELWKSFIKHLQIAIDKTAEGIHFHLTYQKYNEPELVLNPFCHGPLEKGLDISDGGAEFYNLAIDGAGLATVADSFAALEEQIEKRNSLTWDEVFSAIQQNYSDLKSNRICGLLKNSPKFGGGNSLGDFWAEKISSEFTRLVKKLDRKYASIGYKFLPGWFSWAHTLEFGKHVMATPDGRKSGNPISHGANPNPGFRKDGAVTAMANAIAKIQPGYGNTAPMQLELDPSLVNDDIIEKIADFISTFFDLGGTLLNINIIDEQKILEAHKDPSKCSHIQRERSYLRY